MKVIQAGCGCRAVDTPSLEWRFCLLHAAAQEMAALLHKVAMQVCDHGTREYCVRLDARELLAKAGQ